MLWTLVYQLWNLLNFSHRANNLLLNRATRISRGLFAQLTKNSIYRVGFAKPLKLKVPMVSMGLHTFVKSLKRRSSSKFYPTIADDCSRRGIRQKMKTWDWQLGRNVSKSWFARKVPQMVLKAQPGTLSCKSKSMQRESLQWIRLARKHLWHRTAEEDI